MIEVFLTVYWLLALCVVICCFILLLDTYSISTPLISKVSKWLRAIFKFEKKDNF
jgi:hypothetical protein